MRLPICLLSYEVFDGTSILLEKLLDQAPMENENVPRNLYCSRTAKAFGSRRASVKRRANPSSRGIKVIQAMPYLKIHVPRRRMITGKSYRRDRSVHREGDPYKFTVPANGVHTGIGAPLQSLITTMLSRNVHLRRVRSEHESVEKRGQVGDVVERQDVRHELIGPHDDDAAVFAIDAAPLENIVLVS